MTGGVLMRSSATRGNLIIVSRRAMEIISSTPKRKYDAKKAAKEAKKELRKQGLKL